MFAELEYILFDSSLSVFFFVYNTFNSLVILFKLIDNLYCNDKRIEIISPVSVVQLLNQIATLPELGLFPYIEYARLQVAGMIRLHKDFLHYLFFLWYYFAAYGKKILKYPGIF